MKYPCFFLFLCLMAACNNNDRTGKKKSLTNADTTAITNIPKVDIVSSYYHHFNDSALEEKITTAIMKLDFVKKANIYIDSFSNHQHGIAFMVDSLGSDKNEIGVQAGYNGETRFETYYTFYVNPKTLEIKVLDVVNDKKLSVREFIKTQKKP